MLVFSKYYLPGYKAGGPIRTIANMVTQFGDEFVFNIATLDRDMGDEAVYPNVVVEAWQEVWGARVRYIPKGNVSIRGVSVLVQAAQPDVIYLNSFFDPTFTLRVLLARRLGLIDDVPIVLAPRGEFSPGALELKAYKKAVYRLVSRVLGIYRGLTWQASSKREAAEIHAAMPYVDKSAIHVAPDMAEFSLVRGAAAERHRPANQDGLRICFLSRIVRKKNLDFALRVVAHVEGNVRLDIYGPIEDKVYYSECEGLINDLPSNCRANYLGPVASSEVRKVMSEYDLFFLPTRGENYGHVIFEALAAGLPVLISDQTSWTDLETAKVGWTPPLGRMEKFVEIISQLQSWTPRQWGQVRLRACEYASEVASNPETLDSNRQLFLTAMAYSDSPN